MNNNGNMGHNNRVSTGAYYKRSSSSSTSSSSSSSCRGFRLKQRRKLLSMQRLRFRLLNLFKLMRRMRSSCCRALRLFFTRRPMTRVKRCNSAGSTSSMRRMLGVEEPYVVRPSCRYGSFDRSNSFYAEAIADCLDFIRRSSVSTDQSCSPPKADI